jgi:hypothetical protein
MRHLLLAVVCAWVAALTAAPAAHAMTVTVKYSVVPFSSGFSGPFSSGDVTGGNVSLRFPNAVSLFSAPSGSATLLALTLTGPSGYFRLLQPIAAASGQISPGRDHIYFGRRTFASPYPYAFTGTNLTGTVGQNHAYSPISVVWSAAGGSAFGAASQPRSIGGFVFWGSMPSGPFIHLFETGAEISRVPEPGSAGLVLLGLVGLATVPGARRFLLRK